jgi:hypothetical protein
VLSELHVVEEDDWRHRGMKHPWAEGGLEQLMRPMKQSKTAVMKTHTMRGLTSGVVRVHCGNRPRKKCVVLGDSFPSWILHLPSLGFEITHILLKSTQYLALIRRLCGLVVPIWSGSEWEKSVSLWPRLDKDAVAFVDGRAGEGILALLSGIGIDDVYSTYSPCQPSKGWYNRHVTVTHSSVGGVTTKDIIVVQHSRAGVETCKPNVLLAVQRDATTVLSHSTFGYHFRPKPLCNIVDPLRCENLGTMTYPYYHGGGWLPGVLDRQVKVLTPVLNSTKHGGKWGLRLVSGLEVLLCKDVSEAQAQIIMDPAPPNALLRALLPGKCLGAGFAALSTNGGGETSNGGTAPGSRRDPSGRAGSLKRKLSTQSSPGEQALLLGEFDAMTDGDQAAGAGVLGSLAREKRERLATKADDAEVPEYLWLEHLFEDGSRKDWTIEERTQIQEIHVPLFRKRMLSRWKVNVRKSFGQFLAIKYPKLAALESASCKMVQFQGLEWKYAWTGDRPHGREVYKRWWLTRLSVARLDWVEGCDAVARAARSTWWNWDDGSRPFHWRWPLEYQATIRDGLRVHFQTKMKPYRVAQANEKDPILKQQLVEKLQKAQDRRYISSGKVISLTAFFGVKKGEDDVRPVYDGSVSGLNESIWMPSFVLPTIQSHLRQVEAGTYMCDLDVGEMFLNFILHKEIRSMAGVDLTHYFPQPGGGTLWECWHRAAMGLTSSPYQACQGMGFAEEVIRGDRLDATNIFWWDRVRMNLPGSKTYDPSQPWVSKVRDDDGCIAGDFCTFVDDSRPTGPTKREAWQAARQVGSILGYLGIQDAPRKRRDSSQCLGAWTGSVLRTDGGQVRLLVSDDKWLKTKTLIAEVRGMLIERPMSLPHKRLEQIRGYLVHIAQTYPMLSSYLIGLHMTIDCWRPNRDLDGWRFSVSYVQGLKDNGDWPDDYDSTKGPVTVQAVPRLTHDIRAMEVLTQGALPILRRVRGRKTARALYGFGDASQAAFGATIQFEDDLLYQYGQWSSEIVETSSSNWRELSNLVSYLCELAGTRDLGGLKFTCSRITRRLRLRFGKELLPPQNFLNWY